MKTHLLAAALLAMGGAALTQAPQCEACTRVTFVGAPDAKGDRIVVTGRTLDWKTPIPNNIYVLPRGLRRVSYEGDKGAQSISWVSKYGSVVTVGYDMGVSEGLNEKGLVCNLLYLPGTVYALPGDSRPLMSTALWAQYVLDNFATTGEAVEALRFDTFQIDAPDMPGGASTTLHMAIADEKGESAIIEYRDGKIEIHQGEQYKVMTNAPYYKEQLAIRDYWRTVGGLNMLPGTSRSQDRFTRASFYVDAIPADSPHQVALGGVFGIVGNCAVPTGISVPSQPEISTTQWRSVADQTKRVYYYTETLWPSTIWIDLGEFDLYEGAPIMKLDLIGSKPGTLAGDVITKMKQSEKGYTPMYSIPADFKL